MMKKLFVILAFLASTLPGCSDQGAVTKAKAEADAAKAAQAKAEAALAKLEADLAKAKEVPRTDMEKKLVGTWVPSSVSNFFSRIELKADGTCIVVTNDGVTIPDAKYNVKDKRIDIGGKISDDPPLRVSATGVILSVTESELVIQYTEALGLGVKVHYVHPK
jgi:hypothetical protein